MMKVINKMLLLVLAGCAVPVSTTDAVLGQGEAKVAVVDAAHQAQNALDWGGVYQGVLPCASCGGIETELALQYDGNYVLRQTYLTEAPFALQTRGRFDWQSNGSVVVLDDENHSRFFVAEGRLWQLDAQGQRISGALADAYVLQKVR